MTLKIDTEGAKPRFFFLPFERARRNVTHDDATP
jgi:hypothetical protein